MLLRLDHVIYSVPDIEAAHAALTANFPEAWPIGRFWPSGRTCGIALGGINLELVQPDADAPSTRVGTTLVFEPSSPEVAEFALKRQGIACHSFDKIEPNPELLRLRGFSGEEARMPQLICTNILLDKPAETPFDFFCCSYSPFLEGWLSPDHPRLRMARRVTRVVYGTPQPERATSLLANLDYAGEIGIEFRRAEQPAILAIDMSDGPLSWP
ncbi:MAG TPA: hypothetical protein VHE55_18650 [Fimbriimonadaceae bacterium]|nr:hypothetical protein [Fimbriimonadaceae bacterium]